MNLVYDNLVSKFKAMGARARVHPVVLEQRARGRQNVNRALALDVRRDGREEYFDIAVDATRVSLHVLDVRPRRRHLLLMSRATDSGDKEKYLCGHDERAWFVAAIPQGRASNVATAIEALKPAEVRLEQSRRAVRTRDLGRRRTKAYIRQGEWFFVPTAGIAPPDWMILYNEPIRRGGGKPHIVENLFRAGGETVYVCQAYPNGLLTNEYRALLHGNPNARTWRWQVMRRDSSVFAKGAVTHPDHAMIYLADWSRVLLNTESQAPAMRHVAFLD